MSRYITQRDLFRCVPLGILNAMRWSGASVHRGNLPELMRDTGCTKPFGCSTLKSFSRTLRKRLKNYSFVKRDSNPTLGKLESHLRDGGSVLLCYAFSLKYKDEGGHITLITGVSKTGLTFAVANHYGYTGHSEPRRNKTITRSALRNDLRRRHRSYATFPVVWLLTHKRPL